MPARFALSASVGAIIVGSMAGASLAIGVLVTLSVPYLLHGVFAARLPAARWLVCLVLLAASTLWGLTAAASSSTGGLVFLWLLPAQCALAPLAALAAPAALRH